MSITVTFNCCGCDATVPGTSYLKSHFESFNGSGYGFGSWKNDTVEDVTPEGWVAFDPYTRACYCPECWAEITKED